MYTADTSAAVLEFVTNKRCLKLLIGLVQCKLSYNNPDKTQALVLGHSNYEFALRIDNASVSVSEHLKILRVTLDKKLAFKEHTSLSSWKRGYRMTAALRRSRRFLQFETMKRLYKAFPVLCAYSKELIGRCAKKKLKKKWAVEEVNSENWQRNC